MQERIIRYGQNGLIFILSMLFGYWLIGGHINDFIPGNSEKNDWEKIIAILVTIITSPAIGLAFSSIIIGIHLVYHKCRGTHFEFLKPNEPYKQQYLNKISLAFPTDASGVNIGTDGKYEIEDGKLNDVYINHQVLLRQNINVESLKYTARRMEYFWIFWNTSFSILFGLMIGGWIELFGRNFSNEKWEFSLAKSFFLLPILIYFVLGYFQAIKAKRESNDFEKTYIAKYYLFHNSK
jgi:hypothetical protein